MFAAIPFYDRSKSETTRKALPGNNEMLFLNGPSMPAQTSDRDQDLRGPNPLISLAEYTVASQLADSRAPSPQPTPNTEEFYEDPVKLGILPEDAVMGLFFSFHTILNPVIALLDPTLHTPIYVRRRSRVLYTAILAAAWRALSDGISSVEYIQALSIMTYWKEAEDTSTWRKLGLAIRMAFELNLHIARADPLPIDELQARERLNEERTWFQLASYDLATSLRRGKPRMIPEEHFPQGGLKWIQNHSKFPCNADVMIVTSLEMVVHYNLFRSLRSVVTPLNRVQLEPFIRHVISGGERFLDGWPFETIDPNLSPISRSFLRFYHTRMRLALAELKLVLVYNPLPGAAHILMLDCVNAALGLLRHITTEFAPNGYLAYGQDLVPFATAYAGTWLFKQLPRFDEQLRNTTLETFNTLSNACRLQPPVPGNAPLYYAKFFEHLLKHASMQNGANVNTVSTTVLPSSTNLLSEMNPVVSHIPLPDDMNDTWLLAMDGLRYWGADFNYNGQFSPLAQ
ncbi:hypothetical protein RSOLAG22IIIB_06130 [Rhizoctonia solani]|uniref:Transcription factor domain-containing protein n=1 Tax=Rhizoctonia solani TaxID=456999 RepID=A0A0K6GC34_9AGAM|nr:hypothetical protein RSOLAG22IIIB_06130 [Rhizoctonia solani]